MTHGWIITCRQKHLAPDYEKGSRHKNRETEIRETFGEVGQLNDDRKVEGEACGSHQSRTHTPRSLKAFLEQASEIPPNQSWFS